MLPNQHYRQSTQKEDHDPIITLDETVFRLPKIQKEVFCTLTLWWKHNTA